MPNEAVMIAGQVVTKSMGQVVTDFSDSLMPICGKVVACICFISSNVSFRTWWTHIYAGNRALYQEDIISKQLIFLSFFFVETTGYIQMHSTIWTLKMSSAINNPCFAYKIIVFKRKFWQNWKDKRNANCLFMSDWFYKINLLVLQLASCDLL